MIVLPIDLDLRNGFFMHQNKWKGTFLFSWIWILTDLHWKVVKQK